MWWLNGNGGENGGHGGHSNGVKCSRGSGKDAGRPRRKATPGQVSTEQQKRTRGRHEQSTQRRGRSCSTGRPRREGDGSGGGGGVSGERRQQQNPQQQQQLKRRSASASASSRRRVSTSSDEWEENGPPLRTTSSGGGGHVLARTSMESAKAAGGRRASDQRRGGGKLSSSSSSKRKEPSSRNGRGRSSQPSSSRRNGGGRRSSQSPHRGGLGGVGNMLGLNQLGHLVGSGGGNKRNAKKTPSQRARSRPRSKSSSAVARSTSDRQSQRQSQRSTSQSPRQTSKSSRKKTSSSQSTRDGQRHNQKQKQKHPSQSPRHDKNNAGRSDERHGNPRSSSCPATSRVHRTTAHRTAEIRPEAPPADYAYEEEEGGRGMAGSSGSLPMRSIMSIRPSGSSNERQSVVRTELASDALGVASGVAGVTTLGDVTGFGEHGGKSNWPLVGDEEEGLKFAENRAQGEEKLAVEEEYHEEHYVNEDDDDDDDEYEYESAYEYDVVHTLKEGIRSWKMWSHEQDEDDDDDDDMSDGRDLVEDAQQRQHQQQWQQQEQVVYDQEDERQLRHHQEAADEEYAMALATSEIRAELARCRDELGELRGDGDGDDGHEQHDVESLEEFVDEPLDDGSMQEEDNPDYGPGRRRRLPLPELSSAPSFVGRRNRGCSSGSSSGKTSSSPRRPPPPRSPRLASAPNTPPKTNSKKASPARSTDSGRTDSTVESSPSSSPLGARSSPRRSSSLASSSAEGPQHGIGLDGTGHTTVDDGSLEIAPTQHKRAVGCILEESRGGTSSSVGRRSGKSDSNGGVGGSSRRGNGAKENRTGRSRSHRSRTSDKETKSERELRRRKFHARHFGFFAHGRVTTVIPIVCSGIALILSVVSKRSTTFVRLAEPMLLSPTFDRVDRVGLVYLDLCLAREIVTTDLDTGMTTVVEREYSTTATTKSARSPRTDPKEANPATVQPQGVLLPADDGNRHNLLRGNDYYGEFGSIIEDLEHDDYIYVGPSDDEFEAAAEDLLQSEEDEPRVCRSIKITSTSLNDPLWTVARTFLSLAIVFGFLLAFMLCSAAYWTTINLKPVAVGLLLTYFFQSMTFFFFDSKVCRRYSCSMGAGSSSAVAASILWFVSAVGTIWMDMVYRAKMRRKKRRAKRRAKRAAERARRKDLERKRLRMQSVLSGLENTEREVTLTTTSLSYATTSMPSALSGSDSFYRENTGRTNSFCNDESRQQQHPVVGSDSDDSCTPTSTCACSGDKNKQRVDEEYANQLTHEMEGYHISPPQSYGTKAVV